MGEHKMGPSRVNHGLSQCEYCHATDREIAFALGPVCPSAPTVAADLPAGSDDPDTPDSEAAIRRDMYIAIIDAVGEQEAERLIVADMGSVQAVHDHLISIGSIEPEATPRSVPLDPGTAETEATDTLFAAPAPDRFANESPIRAFTDWRAGDHYAIGKGFRPSLTHLVTYLDALRCQEGWALVQILEAGSQSPSFVFRRDVL